MRLDYINPFIDATSAVLEEIFKMKVSRGRLLLRNGPAASKGVVVLMGLTGDVEGSVIFDMQPETALKMAGAMNCSVFESIQPVVLDTIAELINMIMGKALTTLNDSGFVFRLTPPVTFTGDTVFNKTSNIETLVMPFATDYGEILVNVSVRPAN